MYEHLLVPLDGSETAEKALPHAEALAGAFHSTIALVRAVISPETLLAQSAAGAGGVGDMSAPLDPTPILEAEHSSAAEYLAAVEARLKAKGLTVTTDVPEGDAAEVIVERAAALGVSLIIMTSHGRSGLGRLVFGSTADAVLRHAACPLLVIRVHEDS
jgi:nucleotide-binding universal stress UspA family protein